MWKKKQKQKKNKLPKRIDDACILYMLFIFLEISKLENNSGNRI
jgi:hypothetical protein